MRGLDPGRETSVWVASMPTAPSFLTFHSSGPGLCVALGAQLRAVLQVQVWDPKHWVGSGETCTPLGLLPAMLCDLSTNQTGRETEKAWAGGGGGQRSLSSYQTFLESPT